MDELSVDLIIKIFIRIPVKSLLTLRCVSKSWCNIIDDPFFARMQYDFGEVEQRTLLLGTSNPKPWPWPDTTFYASSCDNEEEARVIHAAKIPMAKFQLGGAFGSCMGLMYFAGDSIDNIVVSNPLTGQFRILPSLPIEVYGCWHSHSTAIGLGFDSLTKTFKMVCSHKTTSSSYRTLVHTLGTTLWRRVSSVPAYYCDRYDDKSVFVHGFLHWMTKPLMIKDCGRRIFAFDVRKETFKVIPPPEIDFDKHSELLFRILDIRKKLAMLDFSCRCKIDIWVMDYEKQLWGKEYSIGITILGNICNEFTRVIGHWKRDKLLFYFSNRDDSRSFVKYWSYSMKTGDLKECDVRGYHPKIYSLRGSLISISGAVEVS